MLQNRNTGRACQGCSGGWPDTALDYVKNYGVVEEGTYPYRQKVGQCQSTRLSSSPRVKISGWRNIGYGDEATLKKAVAKTGPVAVGIDAGQAEFSSYSRGIYSSSSCNAARVNHAVLLVGYGTEYGQDYWLVKNSWGSSWGQVSLFQYLYNYFILK